MPEADVAAVRAILCRLAEQAGVEAATTGAVADCNVVLSRGTRAGSAGIGERPLGILQGDVRRAVDWPASAMRSRLVLGEFAAGRLRPDELRRDGSMVLLHESDLQGRPVRRGRRPDQWRCRATR